MCFIHAMQKKWNSNSPLYTVSFCLKSFYYKLTSYMRFNLHMQWRVIPIFTNQKFAHMQNLHVLKHACTCIAYAWLAEFSACRKIPFCTLAVFAKWQTAFNIGVRMEQLAKIVHPSSVYTWRHFAWIADSPPWCTWQFADILKVLITLSRYIYL